MSKIDYLKFGDSDDIITIYPGNYHLLENRITHKIADDHRYLINPYSTRGNGTWLGDVNDLYKVERILKSMYGAPIVSSNISKEYDALYEFRYYWKIYMDRYPRGSWLRHGENHLSDVSKLFFYGVRNNDQNNKLVASRSWITKLATSFDYRLPYQSGLTLVSDNTNNSRYSNEKTFRHFHGEDINTPGRSPFLFRFHDYNRVNLYSEGPRAAILPYTHSNTIKHLQISEHDNKNVTAIVATDDAYQDTLSVVRIEGSNNHLLIEFERPFTVKVETSGYDKNTTMVYVGGTNNVITILIKEPIHFNNGADARNYGWIALNEHSSNKIIIYNEHNFTTNQHKGFIGNVWEPTVNNNTQTFRENGARPSIEHHFHKNTGSMLFADKDLVINLSRTSS